MVRIDYYTVTSFVYIQLLSLLGSGKAKKKKDLLKYDVVLTTVRTHSISTHNQGINSFFHLSTVHDPGSRVARSGG